MSAFGKRLNTASGFIKLKMFLKANEQLEQIEPEQRACTEVLRLRARIYEGLGKANLLKVVQDEIERRLLSAPLYDSEAVSVEPAALTDAPGNYRAEKRGP